MKRKIRGNEKKFLKYMIIFTTAAGFVNGFIGTGGGMILYFALKYAEKFGGGKSELQTRLSGIIFIIIPISAVSALVYFINGNFETTRLPTFIAAGILGGLCGSLCLKRLNPTLLRKIFAAFLIIGGLRMFFS